MRRIIVMEFMTLDGVVQAPGLADEDRSGGFKHGGWHTRYMDDLSMKWVNERISSAGGFLLGRRTYEIFAAYWPKAPREEQALAQPMNDLPKYVASRTLTKPLGWQNSKLLEGDVAQAVAALKREQGGDLLVPGSTQLVRTLVEGHLVDEFEVMIDPVIVGGGKRLFHDDGVLRPLRLVQSRITASGAFIARYEPTVLEAQIPAAERPEQHPPPRARA
ncbi:MAG TPA: dihydrofolate reductase family protein [Myxococcales bacterium]|nr:dihydrofolate reductase family protein [Myxococcales bacterium]